MRSDRAREERSCRVVLVRHALAEGDGRFQGQRDVALAAAGRRQLGDLARKLSQFPICAAYSSDLLRASSTAAFAARKLGVKLETRRGLREMHFGCWQGLTWKQIAKRYPQPAALWLRRFPRLVIDTAERFDDFAKRVRTELRALIAANRGRCILVVTHAGVIRVALASALGIRFRNIFRMAQAPCAVNVIDYFDKGATVCCMNG